MRKRVLYSLTRRKINLYVLILLIFLTAMIYTGISVYQASEKNIKEIEQSYGSSFTINSLKDEGNADFWKEIPVGDDFVRVYVGPRVNEEMLIKVSKEIKQIKGHEIEMSVCVFQEDWDAIPAYWSNEFIAREQELAEGTSENEKELKGKIEYNKGWKSVFDVYSALHSENYEKFYDGTFELAEGRHIIREDKGKVMISRELAKMNDFHVGDTLVLHSYEVDKNLYASEGSWKKEVEIVGLFDVTYTQAVSEFTYEGDIMANWIIMDMDTMTEIRNATGLPIEASMGTFFTENASDTENVMKQVEKLDWIDWNYYYLERNDSLYAEAIKPLNTVKIIMGIGLAVVAATGAILFYLVLTHSVERREREAGILLALGIRAKEIRRQFLIENLILGAVAYVAAVCIAVNFAPIVGDGVLGAFRVEWEPQTYTEEDFAAAYQEGGTELMQTMIQGQREGIPAPETLAVQVEAKYLLLVALLEGAIIFLCTYIALGKTLKWEPAKVLSMVR